MSVHHTNRVHERHFSAHGLSLATLEWPGEGLPVIAVHGWLDNAASFLPLAPLLHNTHLLAPDLPGHGRSDPLPAAAEYHLADNCRWIAALADAMGWDRFVLMGHSMGAGIASITAAALPQRVAALVCIDGLGPLAYTPEQATQRLRQRFATSPGQSKPRSYPDRQSAVTVRQRLGRFPIGELAAGLLIERGMIRQADGYRWSHDERLKQPGTHYYSPEQAEGVLRAIEAPTLLISAENGAFKAWDGLQQRMDCVPQLQHVSLPGGHHLHMESAEAVAAVINRFLARPAGGSRLRQC